MFFDHLRARAQQISGDRQASAVFPSRITAAGDTFKTAVFLALRPEELQLCDLAHSNVEHRQYRQCIDRCGHEAEAKNRVQIAYRSAITSKSSISSGSRTGFAGARNKLYRQLCWAAA